MNEAQKKTYAEIIRYIREERNGLAADSMKELGLDYNMTYGVSSARIKQKAQQLGKDNELALKLWHEDMRETKLFSFHLFDPALLSKAELQELSNGFSNHELAEQACLNLLVHSPHAAQLAQEWATSQQQFVKMAAYALLARLALLRKCDDERFYLGFFPHIQAELGTPSLHIRRSIVSALLRMAKLSSALKTAVTQFAHELQNSNEQAAPYISQNVLAEIEYL